MCQYWTILNIKGLGTRFELEFEKGIREYIEKALYGGTGYFQCQRLENSVWLKVDEVEDSPLADYVRNYEKTWKLRQIFPRLTFLKFIKHFKLSYT